MRTDELIDDLKLKGLRLLQKKDNFKFGIDAVILADFTKAKKRDTVIDLCSGTGAIPFLIWGRYETKKIIGIEIQEDMVEMANRSSKINNLSKTISFINRDLKDIDFLKQLDKVDVVTVNPPYKINLAGIKNPSDKLAISRHEIMCNLEEVIVAGKSVLKDNGRIFMVHRPERLADIITLMRKYNIEPKRIRMVHPNTKKPPNIVLIEGQNFGGKFLKWEAPLYVYKDALEYSDEINEIYNR